MSKSMIRFFLKLLVMVLVACLWAGPVAGQEIPIDRVTLGMDLESHDTVVILENRQQGKRVSIPIGPLEATTIALGLEKTKIPRPLTHDLMRSLLETFKGKLEKVVIHKVEEDTFYATLYLTDAAGSVSEMDARPSDSIALALRTKSPIFVTPAVLQYEKPKAVPLAPAMKPIKVSLDLSPQGKKRRRALELVREGQKLGAAAFTSADGAFDPFKDQSGDRYRKAIPKYDQAIKLCPDLAQAYAARSTAHYFLGNVPAAQRDSRKALQLGKLAPQDLMLLAAPFQGAEARSVLRQCMNLAGPKSSMYSLLWQELAQTYWYEGDFRNAVKELEAVRAWQQTHKSKSGVVTVPLLGMAYEALGDPKSAEKVYQETGEGDGLLRVYIHQERWDDARAVLQQYADQFESDEMLVMSAGVEELSGRLEKVSPEQMAAARRLGGNGSYYAFFLGLFQLRDGQTAAGRETLKTFSESCKANPREWGVTMAWEIRRADQILQSQ